MSRGNHRNDGSVGPASSLIWGSTITPLNQSTATLGYVPQVVAGGGLQLLPSSSLSTPWSDVLADGNTSGANDAIMSAGQALNFADNIVRINSTVNATATNATAINSTAIPAGATSATALGYLAVVNSPNDISLGVGAQCLNSGGSNRVSIGAGAGANGTSGSIAIGQAAQSVSSFDVVVGGSAQSVGTGTERVVIGRSASGGSGVLNYAVAIGSGTVSSSTASVAIGRLASVASGATNSIGIGLSATPAGTNDVSLGPNSSCPGTGGSGGRISIGSSSVAGAAAVPFSLAIGANASALGSSTISIGRLAGSVASALQSINIGLSTSSAGNNDINIGSNAATTNAARSARVCIGVNASISGDNAVAIGPNTTVTHNGASVLGRNATSTADNQVTLGNNAVGACNAVLADVGTTGNLQSTGYIITFNQVRASISPSATQNIASGAGATTVAFATVTYSSDYGSPAITSVASQLQTRANRSMEGYVSIQGTFLGAPAGNGYFTIRIQKNTNGVNTTISAQDVFVLAARTTISVNIPFTDYNATAPGPNVFYYVDCDNPAVFGQILQIQTSSHFVGNMVN